MKTSRTSGKVRLEIRLSPKLRDKIIDAADKNHMTISEYCTRVLGNDTTVAKLLSIYNSNLKIMKLYSAIGNNINQLARHCNELGVGASRSQIRNIVLLIDQATSELKEGSVIDADSKSN